MRSLEKALDLDSTFAMAYYMLVQATRDESAEDALMAKAVEYSGGVTEKERYYIMSRAARMSGDSDLAMEYIERLLERYPDDKTGLSNMAWLHDSALEHDKVIEYYGRIVEVDPLFKENN